MKNSSKSDNNEYQQILDEADNLQAQGLFDEALTLLEKIPEDSSEYSTALFMKSMIVGVGGDEEESFEVFKRFWFEEFGPDSVDMDEKYEPIDMNDPDQLFENALACLYVFEDYEEAIRYFNLSLKIRPKQCEVIHHKALAYGFLGKYNKAVKVIDEAIKINRYNEAYWNDKGVFLTELNYVSKAHKAFDRSISIGTNPHAWANKGILYCQNDKFKKAMHCFDKALSLDKNHMLSVIGKASVYSELNDFKMADKYFKMAEEIDCDDSIFLAEKGKHLLNQNKFHQAITYFDKYLEIDESCAVVWMYKSIALSELARDNESEFCFKKAIKLDPDSISVFDEVVVIEE